MSDTRKDIYLSTAVNNLYNMTYFQGWNFYPINSFSQPSKYYMKNDILIIASHRTTSFVKWQKYMSDSVIEMWFRAGVCMCALYMYNCLDFDIII